jgi:Protein of unknown function (DUF541)
LILRVWAGIGTLLLFASLPAQAQNVRGAPMMGAPGSANAALSDGITVTGLGNLDVPATKATLSVQLSSEKPFTLAEIRPLIDAVAKADGSNDSVTIPPFLMLSSGPMRAFTATGAVNHPTTQMLTAAIPIISTAMASAPAGLTLNSAGVSLSLADCAAYIDRVRSAAVRDARTRAESLAHDLGVSLGAVKAVLVTDQVQNRDGACTQQYFLNGGFNTGFNNGNEPMSMEDYVNVHVAERVTVRFAILPVR